MYSIKKKSKLIATIGPSSDNYEILKKLVENGVTCVRANFSHGDYQEQKRKFDLAKKVSLDLNTPVSIMLDTKGPEIRIGKMKDGVQKIEANQSLKIWVTEEKYKNLLGTSEDISVSYNMSQDLMEGNQVLLDDGKLDTIVEKVTPEYVEVRALNSHNLKTNKRINLPGVAFSLPFLSEKDKKDIAFGVENDINYVAASFVNSKENVLELRAILKSLNAEHVQIISKIESTLGIENIDEIIEHSDGVMIARGDLGLEIPYYEVPYWQKTIIRKCRNVGKVVIVATQMLDSMEHNTNPTRAEVTDVYFATELGADTTMLSGETAQGHFPVEAVQVMSKINQRAEKEFYSKLYYNAQLESNAKLATTKRAKIAYEVAKKTQSGDFKYTVVLSASGNLLKKVANFRPNTSIIGFVQDKKLINAFGIVSSVFVSPESVQKYFELKNNPLAAISTLKNYDARPGDKFLIVHNEKITQHVVE